MIKDRGQHARKLYNQKFLLKICTLHLIHTVNVSTVFLYLEYDEKGTIETISHRENKWLCLPSETDFH